MKMIKMIYAVLNLPKSFFAGNDTQPHETTKSSIDQLLYIKVQHRKANEAYTL